MSRDAGDADEKKDWFNQTITNVNESSSSISRDTPPNTITNTNVIDDLFCILEDLGKSNLSFVESCYEWYLSKEFLTIKQYNALESMANDDR